MASKRQSSPTGTSPSPTTTVPGAAQGVADDLGISAPPTAGGSTGLGGSASMPQSSPIGVPYAATGPGGEIARPPIIDPSTGKQAKDAAGNLLWGPPTRWTAQRPDDRLMGGYVDDQGHRVRAVRDVLPRYYVGDAEAILNSLPPERLRDLQVYMVNLKLFSSKNPNITYGIADNETTQAFSRVLTAGNARGMSYDEVLDLWSKKGIADMQPPEATPGRTISVTNTADLVALFKKTASTALGREISDEQAQQYAATFQGQESAYQRAQYANTDAGTTGTVMAPPSPDVFAENQLKQDQPGEYGATRVANVFDTFQSLLRGPTF